MPMAAVIENPTDLPDAMRAAKRWLVWRAIHDPDKPKPRKVPFYVNGAPRQGALDGPADFARLGTFDQACAALASGRYTGLGFALGPDGDGGYWQGIDFDDLAKRPELQLLADDGLPGYTETSPSGDGLHAIGYGRPFRALGSNASGIEAYSAGRFFTVTAEGSGLGGITDIADYVEKVLAPRHSVDGGGAATASAQMLEYATREQLAELRSALASMRSDDRDLWVSNGHRLKKLGDQGRALWMEWSQTSDKFDPVDAARVWETCHAEHTGFRAVFSEAQRRGWVNPMAGVAPTARPTTAAPISLAPVDLSDLMTAELAPPPFVITPYCPRNVVTLLGGHGGIGKSMLALTMAAHVATGRPWMATEVEQGKAVFLSFEDSAEIVKFRLRCIVEEYQLPIPTDLSIWDGTEIEAELMREAHIGGMADMVETPTMAAVDALVKDAALVVIDNASDTFGGGENVRAQVRKFVRRLARLAKDNGASVMLLVHIDKSAAKNGANGNSYSGSTAWHNSARSRLALVELEDKSIELHHEKLNLGRKAEPVLLDRSAHGVVVPRSGGSTRPAADAAVAAGDAAVVLDLMKQAAAAGAVVPTALSGPLQAGHVLAQLPGAPSLYKTKAAKGRIHTALFRLAQDGLIARESYKKPDRHMAEKWVLVGQEAEELPQIAAVVHDEKCGGYIPPYPPARTPAGGSRGGSRKRDSRTTPAQLPHSRTPDDGEAP